jgi:hypothetical protein
MGKDMSRRGWFAFVGGLLAAFGLVPQAKAKPPAPPSPLPLPPNHCSVYSYDAVPFVEGATTTYVFDASNNLTDVVVPGPHGTVTTFTYPCSTWTRG